MKEIKEYVVLTGIVCAVLFVSWLFPPIYHRLRHLCPVRPSSISDAQALPIFARKYKTSCMTCHEMFPRLNAFGEAVRLNGFRWPDAESSVEKDKEMRKDDPIELGNEAYKKVFPKAVWPSDIPGHLPVSIRGQLYFADTLQTGDRVNEWEWEVQSAASIGEKISYFGHYNLHSTLDKNAATTNASSLILFLNLESVIGPQHLANLQFGIVGQEEANYNFYRSHGTGSFLPNGSPRSFARIQTVPYPAGFAKDNRFKLRRGPGAMVWGFADRMRYAIGYREGDQDGGGSDMNVGFFQLAYKFGGMDNFGRTNQKFEQGYMENSLGIGLLGDYGSVHVQPTATSPIILDTFWRAGADAQWKWLAWTNRAGFVLGGHNNPYGTLNSGYVNTSTWFAESDYHWLPWLLTEVRYEEEYFAVPDALKLGKTNRGRFVPVIAFLYGPNVRFQFSAEAYTDRRDTTKDPDTIRFMVDFGL